MGTIAKITAGGSTHLIASTAYGTCTTEAATVAKVVDMLDDQDFTLTEGATIHVKFTYHNTAANPTLQVGNSATKPIYRYGTTAPSTAAKTSWNAGSVVSFTYDGTGWIMNGWLNDDTTYSYFANLGHANGSFTANSAIYRYQLLFHVDDDTLTPLNNVSDGHGNTNKAMLTNVEFDPFKEIYYYNSTSTVAANATIKAGALYYSVGTADLRYSFNISATVNSLTEHQNVYMKLSPQTNGKVKIAAAFPLTQTLPTTNDGYWYIFLGRAYSKYQMSLYPDHPIYYHNGTDVVLKQNAASSGVVGPATSTANHIVTFAGTDGKEIKDSGFTIGTSVPSGALFTDTKYSNLSLAEAKTGTATTQRTIQASVLKGYIDERIKYTTGTTAPSSPIAGTVWLQKKPAVVTSSETGAAYIHWFFLTLPSGTTSFTFSDSWITDTTVCAVHDLDLHNPPTPITWTFADGSITFSLGSALSENIAFNMLLMK